MRRLLKAEINTVIRKPKLYVLLGILVAAYVIGIITYFATHRTIDITLHLIAAFYTILAIILVSDITHKEYKFRTMKNLIGSGFTRSQIYLGKLIITMLVAFIFAAIEKVMEIIYYIIRGDLKENFFWQADLVDLVREMCLFVIIFIICMLIVSDGLSLLAAFAYAMLLGPLLTFAGPLVHLTDKVVERISAILMLSSDVYIKTKMDKDGLTVLSKSVVPSQLVWWGIGIVVAILALQGGYMLFKRKEFK